MQRQAEPVGSSTRPSAAAVALDALLRGDASVLVAAFGAGGRFVPMPASVPLHGRRLFDGGSGLDVFLSDDHLLLVDAWARAATEAVVRVDARLTADPDRPSSVRFFDLRAEHGVHVIVLEARDPDAVVRSLAERVGRRRGVGHMKRDGVGVVLEIDATTTDLLGWRADDLIGRRSTDLLHPDDVERAIESWMALRAGAPDGRTQIRYRHAQGHYVWLDVTHHSHLDDPELDCVLSEIVDISEQMEQLEALHARERLLAQLAEALPIGICHVRADRAIVYSNEPLVELLGPVDSVEALIRSVAGADRRLVERALAGALDGRPSDLEVGVLDGFEERRCELTFRTITGDEGAVDGVIVCAADVTDRSRLRAELEHRASHDALSGCLNRVATVAALERALRGPQQVAVAYIDVDDFKAINDELGHAAGDELVRVVAARLRSATRVEDRIGRMGGDEFVVIAPQGDGPFEAAALADRLREAITGDVVFGRQRVRVHASVGVTTSLAGELDAEAALARADAAMYDAKRRTRARMVTGSLPSAAS